MATNSGKRRIVFISPTANMNGSEFCLLDLLRGLTLERWEPVVVVPEEGRLTVELQKLGVRWHVCNLRWFGGDGNELGWIRGCKKRIADLQKVLVLEDADLVYTNTIMVIEGAIAARLTGIPHIWHLHEGPLTGFIGQIKRLLRAALLYTLSDAVVTLTSRARNFFAFSSASIFHVVPNGVDVAKFSPPHERRDETSRDRAFLVGILGSLLENKGHLNVIEAMKMLRDRHSMVRCRIVGSGHPDYKERLIRKIREYALEDRIELVDFTDNVVEELRSIDLLISASRRETFPRVILEAMACGKPVVATRSGGPEDILIDGVTGILVPPGDPAALARAILYILSRADMGASMGEAGRTRVFEHFSVGHYQKNLLGIISSVLEPTESTSKHGH